MVLIARTAGHSLEEDMKTWIVELEPGVWMAQGNGDPPRTCIAEHARKFDVWTIARIALGYARTFRPFANARIYQPNPDVSGSRTASQKGIES